MGATNSFIGANFILGQANLVNPSYMIERWHTVLVAYVITLIATFINMVSKCIFTDLSELNIGLRTWKSWIIFGHMKSKCSLY